MKRQTLEQKSKYLSFLLRHSPESANLKLSDQGWCSIDDLVNNTHILYDELLEIVQTDQKQRYSLKPDAVPTLIRANQGHSVNVRLQFEQRQPPLVLLHGTVESNLLNIRKEGLKPMSRHHVHLSEDEATAKSVGGRRKGKVCVLQVDAAAMYAAGHKFFISDNNVWLVDHVPPAFIKETL